MKENLQDNFRQWYMEYKNIFGKYPFINIILYLNKIYNIYFFEIITIIYYFSNYL